MAKMEDRKQECIRRYIPAGLVFIAALALYIGTLPPSILPGDSGELIAASHTLSIGHPPGYPLYLLIGRLFASAVTWGALAYRYNLLSALLAALTSAVLYLALLEIGTGRLIGLAIALGVATHQAFWMQAAVAEVYALNAFFTVTLMYLGIASRRYGEKTFLLLAYVGGLAISHHLTLIYALVGAVLFPLAGFRITPRAKTAVGCLFLGLLGLTPWLYIPIRAGLAPPFTWGPTDTFRGFALHITAARYAWRLKTFDLPARVADFIRFFRLISSEFGLPLIGLGALGVATDPKRLPVVAGALAVVVLSAIHFAAYNIPDIQGHVLPALIGIALLAGVGAEHILAWARRRSRTVGALVAVGVFAIPAVNIGTFSPRQDGWLAPDYAGAIAGSARTTCGPTPVIVTSTDLAGLSLAYLAYVEDRDVIFYMQGISHPSVIGSTTPTRSIAEAVDVAARNFGLSRVAVLGNVEAEALPGGGTICGMVSVPGSGSDCPSPYDYAIRGIGAERRDFFSRALSAEYYLHLARWHSRRQEIAEAADYVEMATELARGDAQTYVDASRLYVEMDSLELAEGLLKKAVEAEPTHFFAHFALANLYQMEGRTAEAVTEYEKALRGNPQPAPCHINLGNIYLTEARYEEALDQYRSALDLEGSNQAALLGMAGALEASGRPQDALAYLDRAILADAGQASAFHAKASLLMESGLHDAARKTLRTGLRASPADPLLLSDMGLYFLRNDRPDSAADYLERALKARPELLTARGNLAVAYERQGLTAKALEQYRAYIEQAPPGPSRQMAERALRELAAESPD
jgi:tetratricopeptide (TPR) repeat protein